MAQSNVIVTKLTWGGCSKGLLIKLGRIKDATLAECVGESSRLTSYNTPTTWLHKLKAFPKKYRVQVPLWSSVHKRKNYLHSPANCLHVCTFGPPVETEHIHSPPFLGLCILPEKTPWKDSIRLRSGHPIDCQAMNQIKKILQWDISKQIQRLGSLATPNV